MPNAVSNVSFSYFVCHNACEIKGKYEKQGKYLSILHKATCNSYFMVKYLLKSNWARVCLIQCNTKLLQNIISKDSKY